jgi:hypothetical protein
MGTDGETLYHWIRSLMQDIAIQRIVENMVELFCVFYVPWVEYIADVFQSQRGSKLVMICIK